MSSIEELEQEIREKRAELKLLKALANPHFSYAELNEQLEKMGVRHPSDGVISSLRMFVSYVVRCRKEMLNYGMIGCFPHRSVKVKEMTPSQIKRANEMISEITPIIIKYTEIALEENEVIIC